VSDAMLAQFKYNQYLVAGFHCRVDFQPGEKGLRELGGPHSGGPSPKQRDLFFNTDAFRVQA
jgi:hypothetical protein